MESRQKCINCQRPLIERKGVWVCLQCNPGQLEYSEIFEDRLVPSGVEGKEDVYIFIDCPGATLYQPDTDIVVAGVKFHNENDPLKGFSIVKEPVYAPTHNKRRRIKREALGKIRRCQGCQDYTVRMRRPEGPDFFIPSYKHPNRTKLKSIEHTRYEPK